MPAGTAVTPIDRPSGQIQQVSFVLDPGSIAAGGSEAETVAIPGVAVGDAVNLAPQIAIPAGILISPVRVTAGLIAFNIENNSAGAIDLASAVWVATIIRGTTMVFAR